MRSILIGTICLMLLAACSSGIKVERKKSFATRTHPQTIFIAPFSTIMVPDGVAEGLFDRFVDDLNAAEKQSGLDYIILKQGLDKITPVWLSKRDYVTGEVFAYVEDSGSTTALIRAKARIKLFQAGEARAVLQLAYPVEIFYQKDQTSLADARRQLAVKISDSMAQKLSAALAGD